MQELSWQHRVAITAPATKRINRVRASWFVLGILAGAAFQPLLSSSGDNRDTAVAESGVFTEASLMPPAKALSLNSLAPGANAVPVGPQAPIWPKTVSITVESGNHISQLLTDHGISYGDAYQIVQTMKSSFNPRRLREGHHISMILAPDPGRQDEKDAAILNNLEIAISKIERLKLWRDGDGNYHAEKIKEPVVTEHQVGEGKITGSLYMTAKRQGVPEQVIAELIRAYSYDVDFQRDIKAGDSFQLLFEKNTTENGEYVSCGDLLYAELKTNGKTLSIYRHEQASGDAGFYDDKGENVKKALLRTPIDGARISSGYGMRRHPILGYSKMHQGVDFAASRGTPIFAAGDGVVSFAGVKGGYGNYVQIRHNGTYSTAYGHAQRFAKGIRNGVRVKQGQVVAYVGSTGRSTGPHLHYEILQAGRQVNPKGVKFTGGDRLGGRELARFNATKNQYASMIASLSVKPTHLAQSGPIGQ